MTETAFAAIEKKIGDLAELVVALKREKADLVAQLQQKDAEIRELSGRVAGLTRERVEIRERVETILSRIEGIEL
jgi:chromosome segregation ATPase